MQLMDAWKEKFAFKDWLEQHFLAWQRERKKRETLAAFAEFLGVSENTLKKWIGGTRKPKGASVDLLANKLDDDIYEILEVPKPDSAIRAMNRILPTLTEDQKKVLLKQAEKMSTQGKNNEPKPRPT